MVGGARWGLALALALAGAAWAQTPAPASGPSTTVSGLTVHGHETAPATAHDRFVEALKFVTSRGQPAHIGQLARWASPVCPIAVGLSPEMNALVAERVQALAFRVGAPQARRRLRCSKPNVEILFTDQPQALIDLVAKKRNDVLGFHYVADERAVTRIVRPIQVWYLTETVAGGGGAAPVDAPGFPGRAQSLDLGDNRAPGGCAGSAFTECLSADFVNILVVADANALSGRQIGPVADYIALVSLAQFKTLDTCDALPTVLDMFTPACADRAVAQAPAAQDVGYLKALYSGNNALKLWIQKSLVAERMAKSPDPGDLAPH
jgi:hypothetical protein